MSLSTPQKTKYSSQPPTRAAPHGSATSRTQADDAANQEATYDAGTRRRSGVSFASLAPSDSISRVRSRSSRDETSPAERVRATGPAATAASYSTQHSKRSSRATSLNGTAWSGTASGNGAPLTENNLDALENAPTESATRDGTLQRNTKQNAGAYNAPVIKSEQAAQTEGRRTTRSYSRVIEEENYEESSATPRASRCPPRDGYEEDEVEEVDYKSRRNSRRYSTRAEQAQAAIARRRSETATEDKAVAERSTAIPSEAASSSQQTQEQTRRASRSIRDGPTKSKVMASPPSNDGRRQTPSRSQVVASAPTNAGSGTRAPPSKSRIIAAAPAGSASASTVSPKDTRVARSQSNAASTVRKDSVTEQSQSATTSPSKPRSATVSSPPSSPISPTDGGWIRKTQIRTAVWPDGREETETMIRVERATA